MSKRYEKLGVSASKDEVHQAIRHLDKGIMPNAFCKVLPDLAGADEHMANLMHADTAGTKTNLAYLWWKETGDLSVWKSIAQDALVMNIDDLACTGAISPVIISSTIGRNKHLIPGEVISAIIAGTQDLLELFRSQGLEVISGGGETADVGDVVRTIDVGITAFARLPRKEVIEVNIQPGDVIVGLSSSGQSTYETSYNSGIGSNGLTAARHDILSSYYRTHYPETVAPQTDPQHTYTGKYRMTDSVVLDGISYTIGQLLTSPTRTFVPVISALLGKEKIRPNGMIHCTGGAQTKVKKFIRDRKVIKDNLFSLPPVFNLISELSLCSKEELYEVYNMGHRMEIYVSADLADAVIGISNSFGIEAKVIGRVEESKGESIEIHSPWGVFQY